MRRHSSAKHHLALLQGLFCGLCILSISVATDARSGLTPYGASDVAAAVRAIDSISPRDWSIADGDVLLDRVVRSSSQAALEALAHQGNSRAQVLLGIGELYGASGFSRDEAAAAEAFRLAAANGNPGGQVMLAVMYESGSGGLPHNDREAVRLLRLATGQGDAGGQMCLADMYQEGRGGLVKDRAEAVRLYRLSARQGDKQARDRLKDLGETP
jgi:TPR repeat protein